MILDCKTLSFPSFKNKSVGEILNDGLIRADVLNCFIRGGYDMFTTDEGVPVNSHGFQTMDTPPSKVDYNTHLIDQKIKFYEKQRDDIIETLTNRYYRHCINGVTSWAIDAYLAYSRARKEGKILDDFHKPESEIFIPVTVDEGYRLEWEVLAAQRAIQKIKKQGYYGGVISSQIGHWSIVIYLNNVNFEQLERLKDNA